MAIYKKDRKMIDDSAEIWAKRINELLKENNMTQAELAKSIEKSEGTISGLMTGAHPRIPTLKAIADVFNVSLDYLVGLTDSRKPNDAYKFAREKFGLSDSAMDFLELLKKGECVYDYSPPFGSPELPLNPETTLELINFFLENISFWKDIEPLLYKYARAKAVEMLGEKAYATTAELYGEDFYKNFNGKLDEKFYEVYGKDKKHPIYEASAYDVDIILFYINRRIEKFADDCRDKLFNIKLTRPQFNVSEDDSPKY